MSRLFFASLSIVCCVAMWWVILGDWVPGPWFTPAALLALLAFRFAQASRR